MICFSSLPKYGPAPAAMGLPWISQVAPLPLLVSKGKGATWEIQGSPIAAGDGPYFGKDEKQIMVVTKEGLQTTEDGGTTWTLAAPPAGSGYEFAPDGWFVNYG